MHDHPHPNQQQVLNRISRAAGHLSAIGRMVEEGRDCSDVLIQLAAVRSAINGVGKLIIGDHMSHCLPKRWSTATGPRWIASPRRWTRS